MIFSSMLVQGMTEPRKKPLQKEVIFTEQPSHQTMMNLLVNYHLKLQIGY